MLTAARAYRKYFEDILRAQKLYSAINNKQCVCRNRWWSDKGETYNIGFLLVDVFFLFYLFSHKNTIKSNYTSKYILSYFLRSLIYYSLLLHSILYFLFFLFFLELIISRHERQHVRAYGVSKNNTLFWKFQALYTKNKQESRKKDSHFPNFFLKHLFLLLIFHKRFSYYVMTHFTYRARINQACKPKEICRRVYTRTRRDFVLGENKKKVRKITTRLRRYTVSPPRSSLFPAAIHGRELRPENGLKNEDSRIQAICSVSRMKKALADRTKFEQTLCPFVFKLR